MLKRLAGSAVCIVPADVSSNTARMCCCGQRSGMPAPDRRALPTAPVLL